MLQAPFGFGAENPPCIKRSLTVADINVNEHYAAIKPPARTRRRTWCGVSPNIISIIARRRR